MSEPSRNITPDTGAGGMISVAPGYQPEQIQQILSRFLSRSEGALILSGPAGAGASGCRVLCGDALQSSDDLSGPGYV